MHKWWLICYAQKSAVRLSQSFCSLAEFHLSSSQRSVLHYAPAQTSRWISIQWRIQFSLSVFYKQAFKEWIWVWHEATHRKTRGKWTETSIQCDCLHYQSNVLCWRNRIWILNHLPEETQRNVLIHKDVSLPSPSINSNGLTRSGSVNATFLCFWNISDRVAAKEGIC